MTIDEAISLVKIERECVIRADACDRKCEKCDLLQDSTELTDMYEQLAEWLEELKCYKNDNDFSDYADRLHKIAFNSGYNKALDDFVKMAYEELLYSEHLTEIDIDYIAEQLKAGASDGNG